MPGESLLAWVIFTAFQLYAFTEWRDDTIAQAVLGFSSFAVAAIFMSYWLHNTMPYLVAAGWLNIVIGVVSLFYAIRNIGVIVAGLMSSRRSLKAKR